MRRRTLAVMAIGAVTAVVTTGCVSIPESGPALGVRAVAQDDARSLRYIPNDPQDGAQPEEIVTGFLDAGSSSAANYRVARKYLSDELAQTWNPSTGVQIRSGDLRFETTAQATGAPNVQSRGDASSGPRDAAGALASLAGARWAEDATPAPTTAPGAGERRSVRVTIGIAGSVDDRGVYTVGSKVTTQQFDFELVKTDAGQWRITRARDGLVLAAGVFRDVFSARELAFYDPSLEHLVPDLRYLADESDSNAFNTRVVSMLAQGPARWMVTPEAAVANPLERFANAQISVHTDDDETVVRFEGDGVTTPGDAELKLIDRQLQLALDVTALRVEFNRAITTYAAPKPSFAGEKPSQPIVARAGQVGYATSDPGAVSPLPSEVFTQRLAQLPGAQAGTYSASQQLLAISTAHGTVAMRAGSAELSSIDGRDGPLTRPSIDPFGFVWSARASVAGPIIVAAPGGPRGELSLLDPLRGDSLVSIAVSRDGARLAQLFSTANGPRLVVSSIVRDAETRLPKALQGMQEMAVPGVNAVETAWVDELTLATLATIDNGTEVVVQPVGGEYSDRTGIPVASQLVTSGSTNSIWVLGADGVFGTSSQQSWVSSRQRALFLIQYVE